MTDRDKIFGKIPEGTYMYCIHCQRAYKHGERRIQTNLKEYMDLCPYEDCEGDAVLDSKEWEDIRTYYPEYPEIPEKGVVYPLNKR